MTLAHIGQKVNNAQYFGCIVVCLECNIPRLIHRLEIEVKFIKKGYLSHIWLVAALVPSKQEPSVLLQPWRINNMASLIGVAILRTHNLISSMDGVKSEASYILASS